MTFIFLFSSHTHFFMVSLSFSSVPKIFMFDSLSTKAIGLRFFFCCKKNTLAKVIYCRKGLCFFDLRYSLTWQGSHRGSWLCGWSHYIHSKKRERYSGTLLLTL